MPTTYEAVIGLEIHAQISSQTKMFCHCANDSFSKEPNSHVCPICLGFPGVLPVLNQETVKKGIKAALALNCEVPSFCKFDRKNYFYPDLPFGYQISQYDLPLGKKGFLEIDLNNQKKKIGITRLHLENDAGKLTHEARGTLCDYNRAGTPLMEIVSEPDLSSAEEASLYSKEIQKILRYVGSSDCDMEKGMMRFDINVSVRPKNQKEFGVKVEIKNLNSFRSLEKALNYEINRQINEIEAGNTIIQETRGWDDDQEITVSQRSKEEAHDYRYFPEPDLPPLNHDQELIEQLRKELPELPNLKRERFIREYALTEKDAHLLSEDFDLSQFFEEAAKLSKTPSKVVPWITTHLLKFLNEDLTNIKDCPVTPQHLADLINSIEFGEISHNIAKEQIFPEIYKSGQSVQEIIQAKGLKQVSDLSSLEEIAKKVLAAYPHVVADYKAGKEKVIGFLVGQVMKKSAGQANPQIVNQIIKKLLQ